MRPLPSFLPSSEARPYEVTTRIRAELVSVGERLLVVSPRNPLSIERSRIDAVRVYNPASTERERELVTSKAISNGVLGGLALGLLAGLVTRWATDDNQTAQYIALGGSFAFVMGANIVSPPMAGLTTLFTTPTPPLREGGPVTVAPQTLEDYVGDYEGERLQLRFSVQQGRLAVVSLEPRRGPAHLTPVSQDEFGSRARRLRFTFDRDVSGAVIRVTATEFDRSMVATRVR